jgi:hypothetical protein
VEEKKERYMEEQKKQDMKEKKGINMKVRTVRKKYHHW